jgi:hypothetical protein
MCASPREPEREAAEAAQRALEEEEEARLASASLAAGDPLPGHRQRQPPGRTWWNAACHRRRSP